MDTPTSRDLSRPAATGDDMDFTLSLEEVAQLYEKAGHARTLRTLQRYCASGHLEAQKVATTLGDKYLVTPQSVARHIAQIAELAALDTVATGRDLSRPVATPVADQQSQKIEKPTTTTGHDEPRQTATVGGELSPYVAQLEREVARSHADSEFLRDQIRTKDTQIAALLERDRETNILVGSLQKMLTPLLGSPRPEPRAEEGNATL